MPKMSYRYLTSKYLTVIDVDVTKLRKYVVDLAGDGKLFTSQDCTSNSGYPVAADNVRSPDYAQDPWELFPSMALKRSVNVRHPTPRCFHSRALCPKNNPHT